MKEINKVSQELLAKGWTKDQTPPGMNPWRDFDGGWTYRYDSRTGVVFESPCGLLWKRSEVSHSGTMYFMGIEWCEENDNITTLCPYYTRTEKCEGNRSELEDHAVCSGFERLRFCALHQTPREWTYEASSQKVKDEAEKVADEKWEVFSEKLHGRACKFQSRYNRTSQEWSMNYDPMRCGGWCDYCTVLQKPLSQKKVNIYYDLKEVRIIRGEGIFPDEERITVVKDKKVNRKPVSETIAEAIVKTCLHDIQAREELSCNADFFMGGLKNVEVINLRASRRPARDILQDLQDVESGIEVIHDSDMKKAAAAKKRENRKLRKDAKEAKRKKRIAETIVKGEMKDWQKRSFLVQLGKEEFEKALQEKADRDAGIGEQMSLLEEVVK